MDSVVCLLIGLHHVIMRHNCLTWPFLLWQLLSAAMAAAGRWAQEPEQNGTSSSPHLVSLQKIHIKPSSDRQMDAKAGPGISSCLLRGQKTKKRVKRAWRTAQWHGASGAGSWNRVITKHFVMPWDRVSITPRNPLIFPQHECIRRNRKLKTNKLLSWTCWIIHFCNLLLSIQTKMAACSCLWRGQHYCWLN